MLSSITRITWTPATLVSWSTLSRSSMYLAIARRIRALPCHRNMRSRGDVVAGDEVGQLAAVVGEHDHGDVEACPPGLEGKLHGVHVPTLTAVMMRLKWGSRWAGAMASGRSTRG